MPDFAKMDLIWLGDGFTRVVGSVGAVPGPFPVYVASPNTASVALVDAARDGSFTAEIVAPPGSWVIVKYDPTGGDWLHRNIVYDQRPSSVNAAPGSMAQVPFGPPEGDGIPFVISGTTLPGHLDFTLRGLMTGEFGAGGSVTIKGIATTYVAQNSTSELVGRRLELSAQLAPLIDSLGRQRIQANQFFSNILTPSGLPVEHRGGPSLAGNALVTGPLSRDGTSNMLSAPFNLTMNIPAGIRAGVYGVWLDTGSDIETGSLGGPRPEVNPFMTNHALPFPPFTVGSPDPAHLVWSLLTDVPSADGSRGTIAGEDAADFQIASRIATQAHRYVIPPFSKSNGEPITYRLEPYLPMVAHGDRYLPNVPNFTFSFPSGSLTVRVTRPDGTIDVLGPAPFTTAYTRTPAASGGPLLDNGGGHLAEVLQLSTGSGAFDYQFPAYGEYTIEMIGTVQDVYENVYTGGGTYTVFLAELLDIEPATLPMTPFEVGDVLNPGLTVLPGVPAQVEVRASLFLDSDPDRKIEYVTSGRANRFGIFTPPVESPSKMEMSGPGELLVETTVSYMAENGVLWMGAARWGQVVAQTNTPLLAHGRRGRDDTPVDNVKLWFTSRLTPGDSAHIQLPFASGDILWQTDDDASRVIVTVQDTEGLVEDAIRAWNQGGNYHARGDHSNPRPTLDKRIRIGEMPLTFSTRSGLNPALAPDDIVAYGYWYGGVQRPGERVREIISDDDIGTGYWRFGEMYALQPGMGVEGDRSADIKFMFGGAVFRDTTRDLNRYGIYGSLWVQIPDDDDLGSRVFPPFQGANGGPSGGPILTLAGTEIDAFVVPLAVRPGTILEAGDTFSFSAQLAPTLPGAITVTVTGPDGVTQVISGRANAVGYFYDPAQDFEVAIPGVYHVSVTATFDSPTSAGPMDGPFPTGTVLGAADGRFDVYVVSPESVPAPTTHAEWSTVIGLQRVPLVVTAPQEQRGTVYFTIGMPGFLLDTGTAELTDGWASVAYDPVALSRTFPNIDTRNGRAGYEPGLVDTVWVNMLVETETGGFHARQFTLQGPDLLVPLQEGEERQIYVPPPTPTPMASEIPTARAGCLSTENKIFSDDFESGIDGWELGPTSAWSVVPDDGSQVLLGQGHVHASVEGRWDEVVWRLRVRVQEGGLHLNFHARDGQRYLIAFRPEGMQLHKHGVQQQMVDQASVHHAQNSWHVVEISLLRGTVRVAVDGATEIEFLDPSPLAAGGVWLEVLDDSSVRFDDIHICQPNN
jgi:hypothetical protein